jgi:hypothetical protein
LFLSPKAVEIMCLQASVNLAESAGFTALAMAAQNNHPQTVALLVAGGPHPEAAELDCGALIMRDF